ncbi:unnamed protein product [Vitrella brassicaformis CCMP3155]|uniref:MYND-type domain-containing protein n=2 Tax=Vitrella brassicaformis TaxID=1169539 RepID=A0A0G4EXJ3_VITBC|nr:unnamed protein product [Vitrella brassicaformis CCMP3155]|eukprot:CEM03319.1 unnamed protein product [Vitrella brassicaformis CCMP3155]
MEGLASGTCEVCGTVTEQRCAACMARFYCSKGCQKRDWRNAHRDNCRRHVNTALTASHDVRHQLQLDDLCRAIRGPFMVFHGRDAETSAPVAQVCHKGQVVSLIRFVESARYITPEDRRMFHVPLSSEHGLVTSISVAGTGDEYALVKALAPLHICRFAAPDVLPTLQRSDDIEPDAKHALPGPHMCFVPVEGLAQRQLSCTFGLALRVGVQFALMSATSFHVVLCTEPADAVASRAVIAMPYMQQREQRELLAAGAEVVWLPVHLPTVVQYPNILPSQRPGEVPVIKTHQERVAGVADRALALGISQTGRRGAPRRRP